MIFIRKIISILRWDLVSNILRLLSLLFSYIKFKITSIIEIKIISKLLFIFINNIRQDFIL